VFSLTRQGVGRKTAATVLAGTSVRSLKDVRFFLQIMSAFLRAVDGANRFGFGALLVPFWTACGFLP
jgi:hypothetical protein